jgi:hypothetical protein
MPSLVSSSRGSVKGSKCSNLFRKRYVPGSKRSRPQKSESNTEPSGCLILPHVLTDINQRSSMRAIIVTPTCFEDRAS